jgi:BarA-like signal transduction histidine kinase
MIEKTPKLGEHRVAEITQAAFTKYPTLKTWGEALNGRTYDWADLMWLESAVMFSTMLDLKDQHGTPSLTVHDSLIVPVSKAEVASETLKSRFQAQQKVVPRLKINWPEP